MSKTRKESIHEMSRLANFRFISALILVCSSEARRWEDVVSVSVYAQSNIDFNRVRFSTERDPSISTPAPSERETPMPSDMPSTMPSTAPSTAPSKPPRVPPFRPGQISQSTDGQQSSAEVSTETERTEAPSPATTASKSPSAQIQTEHQIPIDLFEEGHCLDGYAMYRLIMADTWGYGWDDATIEILEIAKYRNVSNIYSRNETTQNTNTTGAKAEINTENIYSEKNATTHVGKEKNNTTLDTEGERAVSGAAEETQTEAGLFPNETISAKNEEEVSEPGIQTATDPGIDIETTIESSSYNYSESYNGTYDPENLNIAPSNANSKNISTTVDEEGHTVTMSETINTDVSDTRRNRTPRNLAAGVLMTGEESAPSVSRYICLLQQTCYRVIVNGGNWEEEVTWDIFQVSAVSNETHEASAIVTGGAPSDCTFSINTGGDIGDFCPFTCSQTSARTPIRNFELHTLSTQSSYRPQVTTISSTSTSGRRRPIYGSPSNENGDSSSNTHGKGNSSSDTAESAVPSDAPSLSPTETS